MRKRVYIETTIPSFFFETRSDPEMVARRTWTVAWWTEQRHHYELVTSFPVLEELERGNHPHKQQALALLAGFPLLPIEEEVYGIVDAYVRATSCREIREVMHSTWHWPPTTTAISF